MPSISVCITHYNRPSTLGATLESLAVQTRPPCEVFLWDDCSPFDPAEVIGTYRDRFKHFHYERNSANLGMPGNLNAVIRQAKGDYVANLHDADVYHPELLEAWAEVLDADKTEGLAFCRDSRWNNKRFTKFWSPEPEAITEGRHFFEHYFHKRLDSLIWGTAMVRRALYEELLPFDAAYSSWADVDMWMRCCARCKIGYVPRNMIQLDQNPTHETRFSFSRMAMLNQMTLENVKRIYEVEEREVFAQQQYRAWKRRWLQWMLGRCRRAD